MVSCVEVAPPQGNRALRAEAMLWDHERDLMPLGPEVVERDYLLMRRRVNGPASGQTWANRVLFVRTTVSDVDRVIR